MIFLEFAAAKSRQFSGLQNLTSPALMPPDLLQVPQAQYPKVAGLTHRAGASVGTAVQTASTAAMRAGNALPPFPPSDFIGGKFNHRKVRRVETGERRLHDAGARAHEPGA